MTEYHVERSFTAFYREYRAGQRLGTAALECWLPESEQVAEIAALRASGALSLIAEVVEAPKLDTSEAEDASAATQAVG
jgi:hypothetical protein